MERKRVASQRHWDAMLWKSKVMKDSVKLRLGVAKCSNGVD